jgi:hypothetical protein
MNEQLDEFSGALPSELLGRAYRSEDELAWSREDAVEAIDRLEKAGFTVLGVEVWLPTSPGPTMTGWNWSPGDQSIDNDARTVQEFVKYFRWGRFDDILRDREPWFNLTVSDRKANAPEGATDRD